MAKKKIKTKFVGAYDGAIIKEQDAVTVFNGGGLNKVYANKDDKNIVEDFLHKGRYLYLKDLEHCRYVYINAYNRILTEPKLTMLATDKEEHRFNCNTLLVYYEKKFETFFGKPDVLLDNGFVENFNDGNFYAEDIKMPNLRPHYYKCDHPNFDKEDRIEAFRYGTISPTNLISEHKPYTFGIEIETSSGFIPSHIRNKLNMDCQFDGSIVDATGTKDVGGEYTTGVLYGDNGFKHLYEIMNQLSKRCEINQSCSIHVHLGKIIFNKETTVLLYRMYQMIEKELFSMMPPSRGHREHCKKMKHKNMPLNNRGIPYNVLIAKYYKDIFQTMSLGLAPSPKVNKRFNHPKGKTCGWDKNTPRYWWVNFVPALFNVKGIENYTIEVRNMHATLDFELVKNWVLINMAIVSFVENNIRRMKEVVSLTLDEIIETEFNGKAIYLKEYIAGRKALFANIKCNEDEQFIYEPKNNITEDIKDISIKKVLMK